MPDKHQDNSACIGNNGNQPKKCSFSIVVCYKISNNTNKQHHYSECQMHSHSPISFSFASISQ